MKTDAHILDKLKELDFQIIGLENELKNGFNENEKQNTLDHDELCKEYNELIKKVLHRIVVNHEISLQRIYSVICNHIGITIQKMRTPSRKGYLVKARYYSMFFAAELTEYSYEHISIETTGIKNHSKVNTAIKSVTGLIETDKQVKAEIKELRTKIKG